MPKSLNESLASADTSDQGRFARNRSHSVASDQQGQKQGITFAAQDKLPKLPIPELDETLTKYLAALKPLQSPREHAETKQAVEEFLKCDGPELQERLKKYANGKTSYIEQFCRSYATYRCTALICGHRVRFLPELR
jgi:carnitine O-acetyltransferase